MKHTPGPWYPALLPNKVIARPMLGDDAVAVASVGGRTAEETTANARLIAEAPAMREALADIIETYHLAELRDGDIIRLDNLRALLARIDGREA